MQGHVSQTNTELDFGGEVVVRLKAVATGKNHVDIQDFTEKSYWRRTQQSIEVGITLKVTSQGHALQTVYQQAV